MSVMTTDAGWRHAADLRAVLEQIWESLAEAADGFDFSATSFSVPDGTALVRAEVCLHGQWEGLVRVLCDDRMAQIIAGHMLSLPASELIPEDVDDALGEIANIVGGNVKSLLDGVERLSLPRVDRPVAPEGLHGDHVHACIATWADHQILVQVAGQP